MVFQNIKNDGIRGQTMNKLLDIRNCAFHYKAMIEDFPDGLTGLMRLTPSERLREYIVDLRLCTPPHHRFSWIHPILIRPFISLQFLVHRTEKTLVSQPFIRVENIVFGRPSMSVHDLGPSMLDVAMYD